MRSKGVVSKIASSFAFAVVSAFDGLSRRGR